MNSVEYVYDNDPMPEGLKPDVDLPEKKWFKQGSEQTIFQNPQDENGKYNFSGWDTTDEIGEVKDGKFKRFAQSCSYFPHFISVTVVVGIMINMLNPTSGVLSLLVQKWFGAEPVDLFVQPSFFRPLYIISGMWQGAGWGAIIYLGAINGIDQTLYEAAAIDGCGRLRRIWHITIPGIKAVVITCLILHIGSMLSVGADKILLMYSPGIYKTADVISTFVYRQGLGAAEYGYGAAVGLFNSVVNIILLIASNAICKKVADESMF